MRGKQKLFLFLGLLLLFFLVGPSAYAKNSLWQIKKGDNTLFLLGSLHVLTKDSYPLAPIIEQVYSVSDTLMFETSMDMDTPATQKKIISYGMLPADQTIARFISPKTNQTLHDTLSAHNLPTAICQQMRPWFCALTITVLELEKQGFLAEYGLDSYFYTKGQEDKKRIIPLESVEFQLSLFFSQSRSEQEEFLNQTLSDLTVVDTLSEEMKRAWRTGDSGSLHQLISKSFQNFPKQYQRLLLNRNKNWLPILEKALKQNKTTLVVVGAGHLVGPGSVVDLFKRKGYSVDQK